MISAHRTLLAACIAVLVGASSVLWSLDANAAPRSAHIYFVREKAIYGPWAPPIKVNGKEIGRLANGAYLAIERPPGRYSLRTEPLLGLGFFEADLTVAAGETYYVQLAPVQMETGGGLVPALAHAITGGNFSTPMPGRAFNAAFQFNRLDAVTGAAIVAKLKADR
ncbi:MAG TPA: DUF2846 domain-containing protein [Pseudolabrys sp.]|nr:DUF2846 domain-containing protein [Pseudolabrys sp.]